MEKLLRLVNFYRKAKNVNMISESFVPYKPMGFFRFPVQHSQKGIPLRSAKPKTKWMQSTTNNYLLIEFLSCVFDGASHLVH